jgi:hypothetical protein
VQQYHQKASLRSPSLCRRRKEIFGRLRRSAAEPRDSPPPSAAPAAGGWGSPVPACIYGRVGWRSRRRRLGGGGAGGGWFGVGAAFSGGGAPGGSSSSGSTCGGSRPGVVLESFGFPPDSCWRRIWRPDLRAGHPRWLLSASTAKTASARWSRWSGRALAVLVHRHKFRRCAADGPCGGLQQERCSRGAVRRGTAAFVVDAGGDAAVCSGSVSPTYDVMYFVSVLCTMYVVLC